MLEKLLPNNPDLHIEIIVDYGLADIVAEGYDAGVRRGESLAKDMVAVSVRPRMRMAVVGSPEYFASHPQPTDPSELSRHNCIGIRLPTYGGVFPWEFEKDGKEIKVRIEGQLVFNNIALRMEAALKGLGLAYIPDDLVQAHLSEGRLIRVLADWCEPLDGYHLYYPSRRQTSRAFTLFRDALRYEG